jgi:hypothetical protein
MRNLSWKKRKVIAILFALSLPFSVLAQGGLFQRGDGNTDQNSGLMRSGEATITMTNQTFGNPNGSDLTNQTFGAPIGSGLFVMLMAGAGYAAMKTNKKTNKK